MKRYWQALSPRTQLATAVLAAASLVALSVVGVLGPLQGWRDTLADEQDALRRELQSVQGLANELQELRANPRLEPEDSASARVSLSALVEQSLQGRPFQPSSMQLNEAGQMQLRVDGVVFEEALTWLHELDSYPGVLTTATTVSQESGGRVSLGLTLQQL